MALLIIWALIYHLGWWSVPIFLGWILLVGVVQAIRKR